MNALKALVIGMAVLIVIGIGLVGYGLMRGKQQASSQPQTVTLLTTAEGTPFDVTLPLPHGARLEQVAATADRIVLRLSGPEGDKLLLIDSRTGKLAGTLALVSDNTR